MGGAWFAAMPVVDTLASVLQAEQAGESAGSKVRLAFVTAAILSIIEFTSEAGTAQTTTWISTWPMMRDAVSDPDPSQYFGALQTLEMTYLIAKSRTIWLYALDRILLMVGLVSTAYVIYGTPNRRLALWFAHYSVL